ncbi:MAG: CU044_2847 family protein, partial [Bacteroidota bacterium]
FDLLVFEDEEIFIELFEKTINTRSGKEESKNVKKAEKTFQKALAPVRKIANNALAQIRQFNESLEEVVLEMGIKINGEANAVVSKVIGETHFKLQIKWTDASMRRARENNPIT